MRPSKPLWMGVVAAAALAGGAAAYSQSPVMNADPWQPGHCYRVFPSTPDKYHTFKVLERPSGTWVRVEPSPPSALPVPGGRSQAPLWINISSPFAVQEWTCDSQD